MNHSQSTHRKALSVTCYLDESATDGGTPTAVVGGLLLNEHDGFSLDRQWRDMLNEFGLTVLHMRDFQAHRFDQSAKSRILSRATKIIADNRIYSLSAMLEHEDYRNSFSDETRRDHSPYELCFILAALANAKMAQFNKYQEPIAFVVDQGNRYADQVRLAHAEMDGLYQATGFPTNMGKLWFADDQNVTALQAADVICWGARRKATATVNRFPKEFSCIEDLISDPKHHEMIPMEREAMMALESYFQSRRGDDHLQKP
jgi:hypothetical protein